MNTFNIVPLREIVSLNDPLYCTCAIVNSVTISSKGTLINIYDESYHCNLFINGYHCKAIKPSDIVIFRMAKKVSQLLLNNNNNNDNALSDEVNEVASSNAEAAAAAGDCLTTLKVKIYHLASCSGLPDQGNDVWSIKNKLVLDTHHWIRIGQLQSYFMKKLEKQRLSDVINDDSVSELSFLALIVSSHVVDCSGNLLLCVWDGSESNNTFSHCSISYERHEAYCVKESENSHKLVEHILTNWPLTRWWLIIDKATYANIFKPCNLVAIINAKVDRMRGAIHIGDNRKNGQSVSVINVTSRIFREFFLNRVTSTDSVGQFFNLAPVDSQVSPLEIFSQSNNNNNNNSSDGNSLQCTSVQFEEDEREETIERKKREEEKEEAKSEDEFIRVPGFFFASVEGKSLSSSSSKLYWVQGQAILLPIDESKIIRVNCYNCNSCHNYTTCSTLSDSEKFTSNLYRFCGKNNNKGQQYTDSLMFLGTRNNEKNNSTEQEEYRKEKEEERRENNKKLPHGVKCIECNSRNGCLFFHIEFTIITNEGQILPVVLTGFNAVLVLEVLPIQLVNSNEFGLIEEQIKYKKMVKKKLQQLSSQNLHWILTRSSDVKFISSSSSTSFSHHQSVGERDLVLSVSN